MPRSTKPRKRYTPGFLRLDRRSKVDFALKHYQMVDAIAMGEADAQTMYDFCQAIYAWSKLAHQNDEFEMLVLDRAGDMCNSMVDRYKKIGHVVLTGPELQIAREVAQWMDKKMEKVSPRGLMHAVVKARKDLGLLIGGQK